MLFLLFCVCVVVCFVLVCLFVLRMSTPIPKPRGRESSGPDILGMFQVPGRKGAGRQREKKYPVFLYMGIVLSYLKEKFYEGKKNS